MSRPVVRKTTVEPGLRRIERAYPDGRSTTSWEIRLAPSPGRAVTSGGTFATKEAAKRALVNSRKQVQDGNYATPTPGKVNVEKVAEEWLTDLKNNRRKPRKARTLASNELILKSAHLTDLLAMPVRSVTPQEVERTLDRMDRAIGTQLKFLSVLSQVFTYARRQHLIPTNPCDDVEMGTAPRREFDLPSPDQVEALIRRLSAVETRWGLLAEAAAYTGMRAGELAGLQARDCDFVLGQIKVRRTIVAAHGGRKVDTPKSVGSFRTLTDLDSSLLAHLAAHMANARPTDYVFGWVDAEGTSHPYDHGNFLRRQYGPAVRAGGLDNTFHDLRHFHASLLISLGAPAPLVAARLGHKTPEITMRVYARLFPDAAPIWGAQVRQVRDRATAANVIPLRAAQG